MTDGHVVANGVRMYYEVDGDGEPLVLLHGGVTGIATFDAILPEPARGRRVIAVELQGHGRTPDVDRPLAFETMADDVAALIAHLGLARADVMGYSLGGGVALQLAIRHPEAVRRLVVVSFPFRRDGSYPEVLDAFDQMGPATAEPVAGSPLAELHPDVDFVRLFTKLGELLRRDYDWSEQVAALPRPTLLVFADADSVRPAHMVDFFGLLGGGQRDAGLDGSLRPASRLAILPGLTHYTIAASPQLVAAVTPFLDSA